MRPAGLRLRVVSVSAILLCGVLALSGCQYRYGANRVHDFCDVFQAGIGVTFENPDTGMLPPALGVHAQVSDFANLGGVHFSGLTIEWDGRGFFAGRESRTRLGFAPLQMVRIDQDYSTGRENYFKKSDALWTRRMNSRAQRWADAPGKELDYEFWADEFHQGAPLFHRGWQYWLNSGIEAAICDPILTHAGVDLKLGVDVSEISDFLLGILTLDFKQDDMTSDEFEEYAEGGGGSVSHRRKPASD
jgi:hypothetical protein